MAQADQNEQGDLLSTLTRRVFGAATAAAIAATVLAGAPAAATPTTPVTITMPRLSGHLPVGTRDVDLVDAHRVDPWHPDRQRELMVTVSYPAARSGGTRAPWVSSGVAAVLNQLAASPDVLGLPSGSINWTATRRNAVLDAPAAPGKWPVVLYSPGFGSAREFNASVVDDLASHGYLVVSMSHTYESAAVQFPDGRVVYGNITQSDPATMKTAIDVRVADSRFVLDWVARTLPMADMSRVGMAGHSYGGYTAGETMVQDRRVDAGVDIDGALRYSSDPYLPGQVVTQGLDRPFMLFGADFTDESGTTIPHSHRTPEFDRSWADFWATQRGWKRDLHLDHTTHYSFTDLQFVVPAVRALITPEAAARTVGTINPTESLAAQHEYLSAFFDLHLNGRDRGLFTRSSPCFPDAHFIK